MALIKCPECELQVSDKALSCPHCGFPMQENTPAKHKNSKKKHQRLPNGFGSIVKRKNPALRKPYYVRVCVGKDAFNRPLLKSLKPQSSFATYNEAYEALLNYNRNPYDLRDDITVAELYDKWTDSYFKTLESDTSTRTITAAWAYCSSIYNMRAKDVRARHIKGCMEEGYRIETRGPEKGKKKFASAGTKSRIKSLFNLMYDYALEYEIVDRNYARTFDISKDVIKEKEAATREHIVFTENEIDILWKNLDKTKYVDWILIQCYMGWRPQELAILELKDVDLDNWTITGGMKTESGKQRIIPIHSRIKDLIKKNYDYAISINSEHLFNAKGQTHSGTWKLTYDKYAKRFHEVIKTLNLNPDHRPHDPRTTFVTRAKKAGIDDGALKKIIGHKSSDITEAAYTKRDIEWLRKDIEKIK